jgi:hypothetical protein
MPKSPEFGMQRLPTIHEKQAFHSDQEPEKRASELIDKVAGSNFIALMSYGDFRSGTPDRQSTMSGYYQLNFAPLVKSDKFFDAEKQFHASAKEAAAKLYASGKNVARFSMDYAGIPAAVNLKAVFPSSQQCLSCHKTAEKGKPIGILALIRVPK